MFDKFEMKLLHYLGEQTNFASWIEPFFVKMQEDDQLVDDLIYLQANSGAKAIFDANELTDFWFRQIIAYFGISRVAHHEMLPFPTIYLCEHDFPFLSVLKTRQRNKLKAGS